MGEAAHAKERQVKAGLADLDDAAGGVTAPLKPGLRPEVVGEFRPLQMGLIYFSNAYEEPGVMSQKGGFSGLSVAYEKFGERPRLLGRIAGEVSFGALSYNGSIQNLSTGEIRPHTTTGTDYLFNLKASAGVPLELSERVQVLGLVGYGFRYLNDQMQGEAAYEREITYTYLPLAIELRFFFSRKFALTAAYEWDRFLYGRVKSHMTQVGATDDLLNSQTKGVGHRFTVDFVTALESGRELHIAPYFQRWDVDDSDRAVVYQLNQRFLMYEPKNNTVQYGVTVALGL